MRSAWEEAREFLKGVLSCEGCDHYNLDSHAAALVELLTRHEAEVREEMIALACRSVVVERDGPLKTRPWALRMFGGLLCRDSSTPDAAERLAEYARDKIRAALRAGKGEG